MAQKTAPTGFVLHGAFNYAQYLAVAFFGYGRYPSTSKEKIYSPKRGEA
jgi:hypothetical protein